MLWLLEAISRCTLHCLPHTTDTCSLIRTSCLHKSLQIWNLAPSHSNFTDSPGKPGCLAALCKPWNIISHFDSYSLQIFKSSRVLKQHPRACSHLWNGQLGQLQKDALQPRFIYQQALSDISTPGRSMSMGYNPTHQIWRKDNFQTCQLRDVIIQNNKLKEVEGGGGESF